MTSTVPAPGLSVWAEPQAPLPPALAAEAVPESSVQRAVPQQVSEAEAAEPPVLLAYQALSLADSLFRLPQIRTREGKHSGPTQRHGIQSHRPSRAQPVILALSIENLRDPLKTIDVTDRLVRS